MRTRPRNARRYLSRWEHRVLAPLGLQNPVRFVRFPPLARSLRRRAARVVSNIDWKRGASSHMSLFHRSEGLLARESPPPLRISHDPASPSPRPQPCADPPNPGPPVDNRSPHNLSARRATTHRTSPLGCAATCCMILLSLRMTRAAMRASVTTPEAGPRAGVPAQMPPPQEATATTPTRTTRR